MPPMNQAPKDSHVEKNYKDMPKICYRYSKDTPKICQRYAKYMPKICQTNAIHTP